MATYLRGRGVLTVSPKPDDELLIEYWCFSATKCPKEYRSQKFYNPWFFDEDNNLVCQAARYAEPGIWYGFLKSEFFEKRGYELTGDIDIVGENSADLFTIEMIDKYDGWTGRIGKLISDRVLSDESLKKLAETEVPVFRKGPNLV